jgi:hypothetical protein
MSRIEQREEGVKEVNRIERVLTVPDVLHQRSS